MVRLGWRYYLDCTRYPRSRADELATLRARFAAQPSQRQASPSQRRLALELRQLRVELSQTFGQPATCARCARGHPLPAGRWDGGHCCGGQTTALFSHDEVAALKWAGTTVRDLTPPRSEHHGCVFRGPAGCSLAPADRPSICVRHICAQLREELRTRSDWPQIGRLCRTLTARFARFVISRGSLVWRPETAVEPVLCHRPRAEDFVGRLRRWERNSPPVFTIAASRPALVNRSGLAVEKRQRRAAPARN